MNKYGAQILFVAQIIAHLGLIYGLFYFSFYEWLIVLSIYFLTGCIGMSITFHRLLSHNSFKPFKSFEIIGTCLASYGLVGSSIAWVNNHRAHHRFADTAKDPHSPMFLGYFRVQWLSMFSSTKKLIFVKQLRRDKFHIFMHRNYFTIHLIIFTSLLMLTGVHGACLYYLAPAAILWNFGSFINTICHSMFGYKNYAVRDTSKNNLLLGIFMWGEGYHNNHHAHPASAKYGHKWWEIDISWMIIKRISSSQVLYRKSKYK